MPELRKDPIVGRWVIIASERSKRLFDFQSTVSPEKKASCPFCYGNEGRTPPEILSYRDAATEANSSGWTIRVVPNKFPALEAEGEMNRAGEGMFDKMNGVGAHEVIIETPNHEANLHDLREREVEDILWAYRDRILDLRKDKRFRYVLVFKNKGEAAGATLSHPHSQLIATPIIPKRVKEELSGSESYFRYKERCVYCDMVRQEILDQKRLVIESADIVAFTPFASKFPFECWLLPKKHCSNFEEIQKHEISDLARVLKETISRMSKALGNPPFNYILHTAPTQQSGIEHYHWHLEIMPTLTRVAGFEWGTGFYINPTSPEEAAEYLRNVR